MLYQYRCTACENIWERQLKLADREVPFNEPCPKCETEGNVVQYLGNMPMHIDSHKLGIKKPDQGFREVLSRVHEKTPGSRLKDYVNW